MFFSPGSAVRGFDTLCSHGRLGPRLGLSVKVALQTDTLFKIQTFSSYFLLFSVTFLRDHLWITYTHSCFMRRRWSLWVRLLLAKCLWNHFLSHIFASCTTCLTIQTLCPAALGWSLSWVFQQSVPTQYNWAVDRRNTVYYLNIEFQEHFSLCKMEKDLGYSVMDSVQSVNSRENSSPAEGWPSPAAMVGF